MFYMYIGALQMPMMMMMMMTIIHIFVMQPAVLLLYADKYRLICAHQRQS